MARRRYKKSRRSGKRKIPMLATAGAAIYGMNVIDGYMKEGIPLAKLRAMGIEYDGHFNMSRAISNFAPVLVGVVGSAAASKFRLNRYLSGIPVFKL